MYKYYDIIDKERFELSKNIDKIDAKYKKSKNF